MAKEDEELEPAWRQEALDALAAEPAEWRQEAALTGAGGAPGTAAPSPDPPPQHAQPEVVQQSAPAETGGGATGSWEYEPGAEPPAAGVPGHPLDDPRTADQEWTRAYMVLQQRAGKKVGAPKVPQEVISESAQVQRGVLGPAASAAHAGALVRGAEAQAEKREIQQQIEQHDAQVELQALKKLQEEHRKFAALRDRELAEARAKRERAN